MVASRALDVLLPTGPEPRAGPSSPLDTAKRDYWYWLSAMPATLEIANSDADDVDARLRLGGTAKERHVVLLLPGFRAASTRHGSLAHPPFKTVKVRRRLRVPSALYSHTRT
jgi:hypothetical protein